jgi:hypothetical protein
VLLIDNVGDAPSDANIQVTDTLPAGLSFVSASGSGWNCAFTTKLTCTYDGLANPLAPNDTPLVITVNVTVLSSAPQAIVNTAMVETSGELNLTNNVNTAMCVAPAPAPLLSPFGTILSGLVLLGVAFITLRRQNFSGC